ncbi:MAG: DUF4032 domain-containing protein [Pyrinomonadaceae bacterium]
MIFYKLDHVIEKIFTNEPCLEQKHLFETTGKEFPKEEARKLWAKVIDHKWYVSERLKRDIGLKVAAVDYLENFYEPPVPKPSRNSLSRFVTRFWATQNSVA